MNNFDGQGQCGNSKKCNFNIQLVEDITTCMVEIDEQELKIQQEKFFENSQSEKKQPEEEPLKSEDWICEFCQ